ncbi:hypothetical protein ACIPYS_26520 [Kitasatospora sp. NPDC089913]|nr:hypothetical protein [Streptomyces sp. TLI_053]SDT83102.1 hypothetical protein SAMN05216371_7915 [Streptomyces sp. TLI_053]
MTVLSGLAHDLSVLQPVLTLLQITVGTANVVLRLVALRRTRREQD